MRWTGALPKSLFIPRPTHAAAHICPSLGRPRKRECGGLDRAPQAADLPLPGVMAVEHPSAMAPYAHPTKLVPAVPKDFANVHWEEVEYELDIADERWLQANEGLQLSESQLEFLIDRLEKLKAGSEPPEPPTPAPAAELQLQLPVQAAPFSVTPGQIAALASDTLPTKTVAAVSDWWLQKLADRQRMEPFLQPLLRRLRPQTDFDNCDSAQCFRAHRRQRSIREQRSSVNYREMSTGEINRLARQESAEQRKLRLEADRRKRQQQKLRAAAREAAEAEKVDEATRKRKREEELREAEARKEFTLQERVASVVERMVRIVIRDDREEKRQQRLAREAVAAEQRRIKQAAALRKRNAEQVRQALRSIVSQVEAINFKEQRLGAREAARLRREEASAKMAQLAQERLRDNSNSRGARQIRGPVRAIAYDPVESAVITACVDNSLWKGRLVADAVAPRAGEEDAWRTAAVEWTEIGTALNVVTQTVLGDHLFACDRSNTLWRRSLREDTSQPGFPWRHWGKLGTKQNGVMALTAAGEHLYAATNAGKLMRALAESPTAAWTEVGTADKVKAMTSVPGRYGAALFCFCPLHNLSLTDRFGLCRDSTRKLQFALCADGGFWRREVSAPADGALDGPEDGQWLMLGTPATKLVVSNGMCATGSVVVGSDAHSLLCCGWAGAEGVADDAEAAKRPTQWRRCMPLPPILSAKPKPVGPRGRKKSAKAIASANANGEK
eukprot:COSAG04_NODE_1534_length_6437_cov_144.893026_2_plen_729_part_00